MICFRQGALVVVGGGQEAVVGVGVAVGEVSVEVEVVEVSVETEIWEVLAICAARIKCFK